MTTKKTSDQLDEFFAAEEQEIVQTVKKIKESKSDEYVDAEEALLQGSKAWFYNRLGKFNGSGFPDFMKGGRGKSEYFGEMSKKIIKKVFIERTLSQDGAELYVDELFKKEFRQTQWGHQYEPLARETYEQEYGCSVINAYYNISDKYPTIGGSSDGIVKGKSKIIEIKCPYDIMVHAENLELETIDASHKYYGQIQANILINNVAECDFISFDPRRDMTKRRLKVITVPRDEAYISELIKRVEIAELVIDKMFGYDLDVDSALILSMQEYGE